MEGSGIWNNGSELVQLRDGGLEVVATCEGFQQRNLVFLVEVANDSDRTVTVDPAAFSLVATSSPTETAGTSSSTARRAAVTAPGVIPAIDPEQRLLQADLSRSRAEARRLSQQQTDMLFSMAEVVASVADAGKEVTPEQERERRRTDRDIERMQEEERVAHEATMEAVGRKQYLWANETLRKTTIAPGQMIGGRVRFQVRGADAQYDLVLPLGEATLRTPFQVKMHQP